MANDDWVDFFIYTSEQRRDMALQNDIADTRSFLARQSRERARETANLSERLKQVTGSLDQRLTELSTAFSAYVELQDLKEQASSLYGTSTQQRSDATNVLTRLAKGERPEAMKSDPQYWLPDAVNAVRGLVLGEPDEAAEARARFLDPRADEFVVLGATALQRPELVSNRLAEVMVSDGQFSASQALLWSAALDGAFGAVLDDLKPVIAPTLAKTGWAEWLRSQARKESSVPIRVTPQTSKSASMPTTPLSYLEYVTRPVAEPDEVIPEAAAEYIRSSPVPMGKPEPDAAAEAARATEAGKALTQMMFTMVNEGMPAERDLISRIQYLRRVLADPSKPIEETTAEERVDVTEAVREAIADPGQAPSVRRALLGWVLPQLREAAGELTLPSSSGPSSVVVRAEGTNVAVTAAGYPTDALAPLEKRVGEVAAKGKNDIALWGSIALVCLVATVWFIITGPIYAAYTGVAALGTGINAFRLYRRAVADRRAAEERVARASRELESAQQRAKRADEAVALERSRTEAMAEVLTRRLAG